VTNHDSFTNFHVRDCNRRFFGAAYPSPPYGRTRMNFCFWLYFEALDDWRLEHTGTLDECLELEGRVTGATAVLPEGEQPELFAVNWL
jgi:hypothetical protein